MRESSLLLIKINEEYRDVSQMNPRSNVVLCFRLTVSYNDVLLRYVYDDCMRCCIRKERLN